MSDATCFSRHQLRSYLLGDLSEAASDQVALHVEACIDCEATISDLDLASDTLIESLRTPVVQEDSASAYRLAAKRSRSLWKQAEGTAANVTGESVTSLPRLRDYELIEPLASGGMGTVYRARHLRLNRQVALKVLPQRWLTSPAVVARFEREMQAVGSLRHPAIIQATDGGEADGVHFLVMELIDGLDGSELVAQLGPLSIADACEIARQAAVGMQYVHQQGIIHRDIKPSNIMVTAAGEVKVLDLGLARVVGEQLAGDELTTVGQLMGTLDFMAPEQLENSHEVDERTDIYSLGATLYKLLTGNSPHTTESGEPLLSKLRRIASDPPVPLKQRRSDVPAALGQLVDQMLSRSAADRPASMEAVSDALATHSGLSCLAKRVKEATKLRRKKERVTESPPLSGALASHASTPPGVRDRSRWTRIMPWLAAASLMLAAIMGVVITVQTSAGTLVIESARPGVEIRVLKAKQPYRQFQLSQKAESLKLGAGDYEIEIVSDADELEIQNGIFTLKRGETWLAKIVLRPAADEPPAGVDQPLVSVEQPTYEGKTRSQWLALLRTERSGKQVYEACNALQKLTAETSDDSETVEALLVASRFHSVSSYHHISEKSRERIWDSLRKVLDRCAPRVVLDAMSVELERDKQGNAAFVLEYLAYQHERLRPIVGDRLLAQVQRIASHESSSRRIEGLDVLRLIGPQETAKRLLALALLDKDVDVQLFAATSLIRMKANVPDVVSTLAAIVASGEVINRRAQAAWLLGDLGSDAKPAIPELTECLEEEDLNVAMAAAYHPPSISGGRYSRLGMVSVKDAAVRALAEIGDDAVVLALLAEWERRVSGVGRDRISATWHRSGRTIANSYTVDWVADAIEELTGMYPKSQRGPSGNNVTVWYIGENSFARAYYVGFKYDLSALPDSPYEIAKRLLPLASDFEFEEAAHSVSRANRRPGPAELDLEIKLIELLATRDDPQKVLQATLFRWDRCERPNEDEWNPGEREAMREAYRGCVLRIMKASDDWETTMIPLVVDLSHKGVLSATRLLISMLPDLEPQQEVDSIVTLFQQTAEFGDATFADTNDTVATWISDPDKFAALQQRAEKMSGREWITLMIGMMRSGQAEAKAKESLINHFVDDSVDRRDVLEYLIGTLGDRPDLSGLIIQLIEHPVLDEIASVTVGAAGRNEISMRAAKYLKLLKDVPERHRVEIRKMLQRLAKSGKNGEPQAASRVLEEW